MMLLYKFWKESQLRLLAGVATLTVFCTSAVWFRPAVQAALPAPLTGDSYIRYIDAEVFNSFGKLVFILAVIFLGVGGLLRERARHTEIFTLALPVSRARLAGAQIAVGLACLAALAFLPALLIEPLSAVVHETYPLTQALRFGILRFLCGAFIFALAFLFSVVLRGEYTAPMAAFVAMLVPAQAQQRAPIAREYILNPLSAMAGRWIAQSNINDPFPWPGLAILLLAVLAFFAAAIRIMQRQNL